MFAEMFHNPVDIGKPNPIVRVEGPETLSMEPPVQPPRFTHLYHRPGRFRIQSPAALPAATPTDLGQVGFYVRFHTYIIIRL